MGRESRVIKPRTFTYWPNANGAKRRTSMTRVTDGAGARSFAHRMVRWYLDGLWTRNKRQSAQKIQVYNSATSAPVSTSVQVSSTGGADL